MDIINLIDDKTILITPNNIKVKLLKDNKKLLNIKSYTKADLKKKILFDYNEQTVHYMMKKYNLKADVALMYLQNMYYIDDANYDENKLRTLSTWKQDLINHNSLIKDSLFLDSMNNAKVIVYGYDYIDKFFKKMINIISEHTNVEIIEHNDSKNHQVKIYAFDDIDDEINYVAYSICELINKGIDINNIKLGNITDEYINPIKRILSFYNIPINFNDGVSLYGTNIVLSFVDIFNETRSLKDSLEKLSTIYNLLDQNNLDIYNKIVNICNKYLWYEKDTDDITNMLISEFKRTYVKVSNMTNAVEVVDLKDNITLEDKYVFVMGFNQGSMPIIYKNEDYLTDDLSGTLNLETTYEKNVIERQTCLNIIKRLSNVIITYKLKTKAAVYYPSSLIEDLETEVIYNSKTPINLSYSEVQDEISLSKKLDKLDKYDELEHETDILYHNYQNTVYKSYDNGFKGINNEMLLNYLKPKLKLSYSSIDNYFKCAFKFYINNIMNFKDREEAFYLTIGNLFHYILSIAFKPYFDFDKSWDEYLKDKKLSSKEQFLLIKLRDELKFIIITINDHNALSTFDKALYEEKIYVNLPHKIDVTFSGIIDKIMYKESDRSLVSLIDYKTGNTDININNAIHGLNMQLPVYLYLVKHSDKFKNPMFVGFYLQEILHNEIYNDHTKDYETKKKDALKLKGYTLDQENLITQFDTSYKDSRVIKSMKISSKGFYAYSKVVSDDQVNKLVELVGNKIEEGTNNILDGKFDVNPKRLGGKNIACEFCDFRDMCYMKDSDVITLREYKNNDALGGEDNE